MEKILQQEEKNPILEKFQKKVINKSLEIKGIKKYNLNGDLIYNIDNIKIECKKREGLNLIKYICFILNENREDLLIRFYETLGKDFLLRKFYETLEIENKGGIYKKIPNNKKEDNEIFIIENKERKTSGGVLFSLLKQDNESKLIYKKLTKIDFKERNSRKKTYKLLKKLAL